MTKAQSFDGLVNVLKDIGANSIPQSMKTDILQGEVIGINPISIKIHGESDLVIPPDLVILSPLCKEKIVTVQSENALGSHTHAFTGTGSGNGSATGSVALTGSSTVDGKTGTASVNGSVNVPVTTEVSVSGTTESVGLSHSHSISILIWRGLQVGDRVNVLRFNQGGSFYVMDRGEV